MGILIVSQMMPRKEAHLVEPEDEGGCFQTGQICHINEDEGIYWRQLLRKT